MKYEDWPWKMTEKKMGSHEEMGISSTRIWGFSSSNRIHLPIVAVFQQWKIWENGNHHSWEYREWDDVVKTPSHWVPNILDIFCRVSWLRWCCYGVVKRLVLLCGWNSRTENNFPNGFFKHMFCPVGTYNMCRFQIVMKKVCNWVPSKLN